MSAELLRSHWALVAAAAVALVIVCVLLLQTAAASAPAQLRRARRTLAADRRRLRRAQNAVDKAEKHLRDLERRADRVKPRIVQETSEALEDAKALARIAGDRVMVAENHVRRIILEEFAPAKQERLRAKYLRDSTRDQRPFSF